MDVHDHKIQRGKTHRITCTGLGGVEYRDGIQWFWEPNHPHSRAGTIIDLAYEIEEQDRRADVYEKYRIQAEKELYSVKSELVIYAMGDLDAGKYTCRANDYGAADFYNKTIELKDVIGSTLTCRQDEFKCDEDLCIPEAYVCNIAKDCQDGTDEEGCGKFNFRSSVAGRIITVFASITVCFC
ncbi:low-density lipoprotein receptor-related protein [Elysia marginata]|uniref:Low-density lipoprotein receptor-related protein n=1 Tax=Elysia marginata TaxID=1093978 RepID=A0AAV4EJA0_9GAST|nr:low-density lipoprotein receptor-related protein [Elysia marginata]